MEYQSFNMGAYNLHIANTKKFKTITVDISFRKPLKREDISKRIILKEMLLHSNYDYKTEKELVEETENLYDLKLFSSSSRIGNYTNLSFKTRFLNETYTEKGMNEDSLLFLMNVIFKPNIIDKKFNKEVLSYIKNNHIKNIKNIKDNKIKYAMFSLLEYFPDKPYSYSPYGTIEDVESITESNLYEYYQEELNNDIVDIFVVGNIDVKKIKDFFKEYFKIKTFHKKNNDIIVPELQPRKRIRKYTLEDDVNQSQVVLLYTLNNLTDYERKYVLLVYNELLGGSSSSVLFNNIREKKSYAYYINSMVKSYDNILMIYSGIENNNEEVVTKLIRKNVDNVGKGKYDITYLESAKETLISSIIASIDSPIGIINTYFAKILVNSDDPETRIENIRKVTVNDIINLSKKIKIHTSLVLKGVNNGNKN